MLATEANESGTSGVFPSKIPVVANQRTDEGTSVLSEIARAVPIEMEQLWLRVKKQLHGLLCCSISRARSTVKRSSTAGRVTAGRGEHCSSMCGLCINRCRPRLACFQQLIVGAFLATDRLLAFRSSTCTARQQSVFLISNCHRLRQQQ